MLTRDELLNAAIELADRSGLDGLTMRGLADHLGVSAMSLYAHVTDKDDIVDAVIERRLRERAMPPADRPWREWLTEFAQRLRQLLVVEPALLERYCRRPVGVPAALERMEAALRVLVQSGFSDEEALRAFAAVHTYTIGFSALEAARSSQRRQRSRHGLAPLDETVPGYWPAYFASLDPHRYPSLQRIRPDLASFATDTQFKAGLDALLDGLAPSSGGDA